MNIPCKIFKIVLKAKEDVVLPIGRGLLQVSSQGISGVAALWYVASPFSTIIHIDQGDSFLEESKSPRKIGLYQQDGYLHLISAYDQTYIIDVVCFDAKIA